MLTASYLHHLNIGAASLHALQAIIVICIIGASHNSEKGPLLSGVYALKKNVYVLRNISAEPKCSLPRMSPGNSSTDASVLQLCLASSSSDSNNNNIVATTTSDNFYAFDKDAYGVPATFVVGYVNVRYLIFGFFVLSAVFQGLDAALFHIDSDESRYLRFAEYSISGSVVALAIAVEVGIFDVFALSLIFTLVFTTNILGLIAERMSCLAERYPQNADMTWCWILPHVLAWATCLMAYAPLLDTYFQSTGCSDRTPPGFVNVIVFIEFFLFICFGFVQLYSLSNRSLMISTGSTHQSSTNNYKLTPRSCQRLYSYSVTLYDIDQSTTTDRQGSGLLEEEQAPSVLQMITRQANFAYILLSFTAKTLLAWLILSPTLT